MTRLMKKLEDIMVAITFAEAGEFETAERMIDEAEWLNKGKAKPSEEAVAPATETVRSR